MGAFGSCLGVGRPIKPGANPRLLGSNLVNVNPFGQQPNGAQQSRQSFVGRPPPSARTAYLSSQSGGGGTNGCPPKGLTPMPKLTRQSSSMSSQQQHHLPFNSPQQQQQQVPKLVDIDDNPTSNIMGNQMARGKPAINAASQLQQAANVKFGPNGDMNAKVLMENIKMNPNSVCEIICLFDYEPRTSEDLGFQKGEHLVTLKECVQDEWWYAMSKSTKKVGWVPSNYVSPLKTIGAEPWYFGKIGRLDAERRLRIPDNADGAFIIRDSDSGANLFSLSLKRGNEIKHYRIRQFEAGGFYIDKRQIFSTIHGLVEHYSQVPDGLCINLREPCVSRFEAPETQGLTHDTCDIYEVDRNCLTIGRELGHGQFGQVFEGWLTLKSGMQTPVAIKTLRKGTMDPKDFLAEAQIMKGMKHENLVKLHAVCTREEPVYIITELMANGALINYLQTDIGKNLSFQIYINMANQIAQGMKYLESKKYVHRDLAARNILVGDRYKCKIADFGLARLIVETEYEARAGARFPIKWTAPEAANFSKFTIKSDVWSFGIVLYEIITKGGTPYPDMSNAEVLNSIDKGYRMPIPPSCEVKYYNIMLDCWNKDPNKRPTFDALEWRLEEYFSSDEQYREMSQLRER